jgi:molybdenum cofactor cytidylyltransferase
MSVACTVLAAKPAPGPGIPNELFHFQDSETLVHWAVQCACGSRCTRVSVVVGPRASEVAESVAALPVEVIQGFDWREGTAAAIRAATLWAIDRSATALLVCGSDQPFLTTRHLNALWFASDHGMRLAASYYGGKAGIPAVIPQRYFGTLLSLQGNEGVESLLRRSSNTVCIAWPEGSVAVDAPGDVTQVPYSTMEPEP